MSDHKVREVIAFRLFERFRDGVLTDVNTHVAAWQKADDDTRLEFREAATEVMNDWPKDSGIRVAVSNSKKLDDALHDILMLPPQPAYQLPEE